MSSITLLQDHHRTELQDIHTTYKSTTRVIGCTTVTASFLVIGALIVMYCASLCLFLPGVNVLTDVVFRAIIPGCLSILASLPFIFLSVKTSLEARMIRRHMIERKIQILDDYKVPEMTREERVRFIKVNLLKWIPQKKGEPIKNIDWDDEYQKGIITSMLERIGKDKKQQNPRQQRMANAFNETLKQIPNLSKKIK